MPNKIQFKRGLESGIPTGDAGEPLWCTDSKQLWIGTGSGNVLIGPDPGAGGTTITFGAPSIFSVTGSPATGDATITLSLANQSKNLVLAGPATGSDTVPTFRALVNDDLPIVDIEHGGTGVDGTGTWVDEEWLYYDMSAGTVKSSVISAFVGTGLAGTLLFEPGGASPTISLANTAVTPGDYGDATGSATFTVDAQGRLTAAGEVTITPAATSITGVTSDRLLGRDSSGTGAVEMITVGGGLTFTGAGGIVISQQVGLSVFGRTTNTTGTMAAIVAGSDGDVLRRSGTSLAFGAIATAGVSDNAITDPKLRDSAALSVIGRSANSTGDPADIAASANNQVLRRSSDTVGFGTIDTAAIGSGTLAEARGGTNQSTYTTGDLLYASAANTLAKRAIGTTGQVLTVTSGAPAWADTVTATRGTATLSATFSITAASGTYEDTGLSVTLPSAGTYLVTADVRASLASGGTNPYIGVKLYNSTDAADVTDSERVVIRTADSTLHESTSTVTSIITVAASKTIKLYAVRSGSSFTTTQILSGAAGRTTMAYVKIA